MDTHHESMLQVGTVKYCFYGDSGYISDEYLDIRFQGSTRPLETDVKVFMAVITAGIVLLNAARFAFRLGA